MLRGLIGPVNISFLSLACQPRQQVYLPSRHSRTSTR